MSGAVREINFDGLVGPTHNYAGLSLGNIASATNYGSASRPREAALQGLAKMRMLMDLGLTQGFFPPPRRPAMAFLRGLGFSGTDREALQRAADEEPQILVNASSASAMWAANAATVMAAADSGDGRVHLVTANLATMAHRAVEADDTHPMLKHVFGNERFFLVHPPLRPAQHFSDEGAANHMRLAPGHAAPGLNLFVHGEEAGNRFPGRQNIRASRAVARLGGLASDATWHIRQTSRAVQAGAFHNDVVAVANEQLLFAHADAFEDKEVLFRALGDALPELQIIEVDQIALDEAVSSYLFNSQLVTLPDGGMALILPGEAEANPKVWSVVQTVLAGNNPINRAIVADLRESMRNGGGPACLRLRVPVSDEAMAAIDQRFILDERRWDQLNRLVETHWPEQISPGDLVTPDLWDAAAAAYDALDTHLSGDTP